MNGMDILSAVLGFIGQVPAVGHILEKVIVFALPLVSVASALVAALHALVLLMQAVSLIPGLSGLAALSEKLKQGEDEANGFVTKYVVPVLNRLSAVPLPKKQG